MNLPLPEIKVQDANVPCGECNACCRGPVKTLLRPTDHGKGYKVRTVDWAGDIRIALRIDHDTGNCIYLIDGKCSIYDNRPETCRMYDCRVMLPEDLPPHILEARPSEFNDQT